MAYTKIGSGVDIEFLKNKDPINETDSEYFNFADLEILKEKHPDANGFRVVHAVVSTGDIYHKRTQVIILVKGKQTTGAERSFQKSGEYVAFSCPPIIDRKGGTKLV